VKSPYIAGDRFTAADVYVGSHLGWGMQFGTIEKRPAFEAYYAKLANRPAAQRATQLDDAAMPKQGGA
jgi:glutathione S-transferase